MIEIAPKALRFARLAALEQASLADSPIVRLMCDEEKSFVSSLGSHSTQKYIKISDEIAAFCVFAIASFLKGREISEEWDGNDFAMMSDLARSLSEQLSHQSFAL